MSRRQDIQSAEGDALDARGYGVVEHVSKSAPVNGVVGYAPGAVWFNLAGTAAAGFRWTNIGGNGFGTNPTAVWVRDDPSSGQQAQFGGGTSYMATSGNLYRTILTVGNEIQPSATGALKIVDIFTLTKNSFDQAGRGLQFSVWCNNAGTSGHAVRIQIVANPSNAGLPASGAGVAGQTDGTITVTGGTVVLDTGASYSPTGTPTFGIVFQGQIFKTGAAGSNTQEAMLTSLLPQAGLTHTTAWADIGLTESAANVFAICISAATTATDIEYQGMEITGFNAQAWPLLVLLAAALPPEAAGFCHLLACLGAVGMALALLRGLRHAQAGRVAHRQQRTRPVAGGNRLAFLGRAWAALLALLGRRNGRADFGLEGGVGPAAPVVLGQPGTLRVGQFTGVAGSAAGQAVDVETGVGVRGLFFPDPVPFTLGQGLAVGNGWHWGIVSPEITGFN